MERKITNKVDDWTKQFKDDIREYVIKDLKINLEDLESNERKIIEFIFNYESLKFIKEDFLKRKRIKNVVPLHDRCCALRANNNQCTRRKKENHNFCGTHIKGTPHGTVKDIGNIQKKIKKQIWVEEIQGIMCYIDSENNVYNHDDIISNIENPKIIAKYAKDIATGKYSIVNKS